MRFARWLAIVIALWPHLPVAGQSPAIVVATYNVENYLGEASGPDVSPRRGKPKSEQAMEAVVQVIKEINPDILNVCEMGEPERFEDFKKRLAAAGLNYVDSEYVQGVDPDRHLALVSRFPIVARQSLGDVPFELNGRPEKVRRGFLDVTIQVNGGYQLRVVSAHLKSKVASADGEATVRRYEAQLLRQHLDAITAAEPHGRLVCLGDFNTLKNEPAYHEITGTRGSNYLYALPAKDENGDTWTEYWKEADLYSRIDYIFVSPALRREIVPGSERVYRSAHWNDASDHRAVFATILPRSR